MILTKGSVSSVSSRAGVGAGALLFLLSFGIAPMALVGQSTVQKPAGHESSTQKAKISPVEAGQQTYSSATEAVKR